RHMAIISGDSGRKKSVYRTIGRSRFSAAFTGTSSRVICGRRGLTTPLPWYESENSTSLMSFRHILFPVDFSARSRGAAPFVRALAARYNAAVTLVHVAESQQHSQEAQKQLAALAAEEFPRIAVTQTVEEGDAGVCI